MPADQHYGNHRRLVPAYHGIAFLCLLGYLALAIWQLVAAPGVASVMQILLAVGVLLIFWYARAFVLTVQDRLIRLEERLRLERLLPPELHHRIPEFTPRQLIALRFADDAELPALAQAVLEQNLHDADAIKRMVTAWRPDHLRA